MVAPSAGAGVMRRPVAMSLTELLPEVQTLSRLDKLHLIQFLAQELERGEGGLIVLPITGPITPPQSLRGTVIRYDRPTEPVAEADWDVLG